MTNREKFKEVFNIEPINEVCLFFKSDLCKKLRYNCWKCKLDSWWDDKYKKNKKE